jgi:acetyltransferase-like isoleucine patch superfamily enzyme
MRAALALMIAMAPSRLRRRLGRWFLGWDIHPTAHVGRSLILARKVTLGPGASIGSFNVIRGLAELRMDVGASIASRNWIVCPPHAYQFTRFPNRYPALIMGKHAIITIGHEIDCSDQVELADQARLIGFRSQILTHSLDLVRDRWSVSPVRIGEQAVVMSGCIMQNGSGVPRRGIVSAGSVVNSRLPAEQTLYRGNPAEAVRPLPDTYRFWHRSLVDDSSEGVEIPRRSAGGEQDRPVVQAGQDEAGLLPRPQLEQNS